MRSSYRLSRFLNLTSCQDDVKRLCDGLPIGEKLRLKKGIRDLQGQASF